MRAGISAGTILAMNSFVRTPKLMLVAEGRDRTERPAAVPVRRYRLVRISGVQRAHGLDRR